MAKRSVLATPGVDRRFRSRELRRVAQMSIDLKSTGRRPEKAILVTVLEEGKESWSAEDRETELKDLVRSCNIEIIGSIVSRRKVLTPNFFIGKGKVDEISGIVLRDGADVVIFNDDLSPTQQQNLEEVMNVKTIDRTQLILEIFARRARSDEGKIQVELAQLLYLLPRLSGKGVQLSRLGGGLGTRGPGEQKLEVDRRRVRERISKLKKSLDGMTMRRDLRRTQRDQFSMLTVALVGYTNSGKSTLFNVLTSSKVTAKDQLFSTLDPTVRKMVLQSNQTVLVSDTVGFLNELPHHLIESFKATLEEAVNADILVLLADISDHRIEQQVTAVKHVLEELEIQEKPVLMALNKIDKVEEAEAERIKKIFNNPVLISALKGSGIDELKDRIAQFMQEDMESIELVLPHKHYSMANVIRERGRVLKEEYTDAGLTISAYLPHKVKNAILKKLQS